MEVWASIIWLGVSVLVAVEVNYFVVLRQMGAAVLDAKFSPDVTLFLININEPNMLASFP